MNDRPAPTSGMVTVVGTCSIDRTGLIDKFPSEDRKYMCEASGEYCGGVAANVAVNLALLGVKVCLVSWVSRDTLGDLVRDRLNAAGVLLDGLATRPDLPQVFTLVCKATGTRTAFMTEHNRPSSLSEAQHDWISDSSFVHYDGSLRDIGQPLFDLCRRRGVSTFFDYDIPSIQNLSILNLSDYAIISRRVLCEDKVLDGEQLTNRLRSAWLSNHQYIGVTLGDSGSIFFDGETTLSNPAIPVGVKDTTGAGDAFQAGLLFGLMEGWEMSQSSRFATALAALKCTQQGPNLVGMAGLDVKQMALDLLGK